METKDIVVPVAALMLNPENPRHDILNGQPEILDWLIKHYDKKILNLAIDISEKGLSPIERMLVANVDGRYIVLEGNRRLAALRILTTPEICKDLELRKKIEGISDKSKIPTEVKAVELINDEDSDWVIERRHSGESEGIGLVRWDTYQKARHDERTKGKTRYAKALAIINFYESCTNQRVGNKINITTLQRMLGQEGRSFLGLEVINDQLHATIPPEEVFKGVKQIILDLLNDLPVSEVYNETALKNYFSKIPAVNRPDCTQKTSPVPLVSANFKASPQKRKANNGRTAIRRKKYLIYLSDFPCSSENNKVLKIINELSSIDVDNAPNACALLLRCFLEVSAKDYLSRIGRLVELKSQDDLTSILSYISNRNNGIIKDADMIKLINRIRSDNKLFGALFDLNDYAHNTYIFPNGEEIRQAWAVHESLFRFFLK